jgi:hypothetical protein
MSKPVWFMDVDGVINVIPSAANRNRIGAPHFRVWKNWHPVTDVEVGGHAYPIRVSSDLVEHINDISQTADIEWLTTWTDAAPTIFAPIFGINDFPVASAKGSDSPFASVSSSIENEYRWWKLNAVIADMETNARPIIWTDDDIWAKYSGNYVKGLAKDMGIPILVISPFDSKGIERYHIDKIREFIKDNS